jgi:hypothetical protein
MGLTQMRFCMVTPRIFKGVKSFGIGLPEGWDSSAVPGAGIWAGV